MCGLVTLLHRRAAAERVKVVLRVRPCLRDDESPGALDYSEAEGQLTLLRP